MYRFYQSCPTLLCPWTRVVLQRTPILVNSVQSLPIFRRPSFYMDCLIDPLGKSNGDHHQLLQNFQFMSLKLPITSEKLLPRRLFALHSKIPRSDNKVTVFYVSKSLRWLDQWEENLDYTDESNVSNLSFLQYPAHNLSFSHKVCTFGVRIFCSEEILLSRLTEHWWWWF